MKVPWRQAWDAALYGNAGYFITTTPAAGFRTAANANPVLAEAIVTLLQREALDTVVDVGAGGGELLAALRQLDPTLSLHGVDLAARPDGLDPEIGWSSSLPTRITGLLLAHEWLDNIPCDVVELDRDGTIRLVEVDPGSGEEALGAAYDSAWLDAWWPLTEPGQRAEVGETRDVIWADAVARVEGIALAIDYAHTRDDRPLFGSLRSYRDGREVDVVPDGTRDVTAHVAADSVAAVVGATTMTQRAALMDLGIDGSRPALELATSDPAAYVRALSRATQAAELVARDGWGDFQWIVVDTRAHGTLST